MSQLEVARNRLAARYGNGKTDAALAGCALSSISSAVSRRGPLMDEQAYLEVQAETERMRRSVQGD